MFHVKVRKRGAKSWSFLSSGGRVNRLRIHAVQFSDQSKAEAVAKEVNDSDPEWEAKVQGA